jgi:hypothetical protein
MARVDERSISERIYFKKSDKKLEVIIRQHIPRWQESLLMAWFAAWTFCGVYFIFEFFNSDDKNLIIALLISIAFWAYFFVRTLKVLVWRTNGAEEITISDGEMRIRNRFWKFGRTAVLKVSNIRKFNVVPYKGSNFFQFLEHSFWVIGGDRIQLEHNGTVYRLGKQLQDKEALALGQLLDKAIRENQK